MNKCKGCRKETKNKIWCSQECRIKYYKNQKKYFDCISCEKKFSRNKCDFNHPNKYCSPKCRNIYELKHHPTRKGEYFTCEFCKKEFYRQPSNIHKNKYCSMKCYSKIRKQNKMKTSNYGNYKRKIIKCKTCKTPFYVRPCEEKHNKQYCSRKCYTKAINLDKSLHPNAGKGIKRGIYKKCALCNKKFYVMHSMKHQKYCSSKCYLEDPKSPNRQFGKDNPMTNPIYKQKAREGFIKYLKETKSSGYGLMFGKNETKILDRLEKHYGINIERHRVVGGYILDGYYKEKNIAIEIDEKYHCDPKVKKKDNIREKEIQNILECEFIRIKDYEAIDYDNVPIKV